MDRGGLEFAGTDRFRVIARLGVGGMGAVYKAFDREQETYVALKTLLRMNATELLRFKTEFRALADLRHPNWVRFGELFEEGGRWFFSMELVEGIDFLSYVRGRAIAAPAEETLLAPSDDEASTVLDVRGATGVPASGAPLSDVTRLRAALAQLARALHALHAAGKVHRDVKPSNIMVTATGRVVLLDFGLVTEARVRRGSEPSWGGTLAYMAPEQAFPGPVGPAADWYAVGVMIYEALTGDVPHAGSSGEVLVAKQRDVPRAPSSVVPGAPPDLDALCMELLRIDPEARPRGEEILARLAVSAPPESAQIAGAEQAGLFVGREHDLTALHDAFRASRAGRGVTLLLAGESGVGKSALVRRFADAIHDEDPSAVVLAGRCYEGEWVPYKALDGVVDALSAHLARWDRAVVDALLPENAGLLAQVFLVLKRIEAFAEAPLPRRDSIEPRELRDRVFAALRRLLAALGARAPLLVVVDDVQWADADSLALLRELLHEPGAPAMLLVLTLRVPSRDALPTLPALIGAAPDALGDVRTTYLSPLSTEQAHALAEALVAATPRSARADPEALAAESGGHPLFLQELVLYRMRAGDSASFSLDEALRARLADLEPGAIELMEAIALAGGRLTQDIAARAAGLSAADYARHAAALRAASLARTTGRRGSDAIEPYHDRVREAVRGRLPADARRVGHRRLARAIEALAGDDHELLAAHWQGAGELDLARDHALRAAARAEEAFAFERAARLYRLAIELRPGDGADRAGVHQKLGDALANAGRSAEAAEAYLVAVASAPASSPAGVSLDLRRRATEQLLRAGLVDRGLEQLDVVLATIDMELPKTPARALASLLVRRAQVRLRGIGFRERAAAEILPQVLARADICWSASVVLGMVDNLRAADFQARGLLLSLDAGEPYRVARALAAEACFASTAGGAGKARTEELLDAAQACARRSGHPFAIAFCMLADGVAAYCMGEFRRSYESSVAAKEILTDRCTGVAWERETADLYTILSLFYLGRLQEQARRVEQGARQADERGDLFASTYVRSGLAMMSWLARDDAAGARAEVARTAERWSSRGYFLAHFWCFIASAQIDLYAGEPQRAFGRIEAEWPRLSGSLLLRSVQIVRVESFHVRARAAIALAARGGIYAERHLRDAARDASRMENERMAYATPLAALVRAGIAAVRGDRGEAAARLRAAIAGFDAIEMRLYGAVARMRLGWLTSDTAAIASSEAWMREEGIASPERFAEMLAPGFPAVRRA